MILRDSEDCPIILSFSLGPIVGSRLLALGIGDDPIFDWALIY